MAIGVVRDRTQRGGVSTGKLYTISRITSKAAEPAPTMIPARSSVTGISALRKVSAVS